MFDLRSSFFYNENHGNQPENPGNHQKITFFARPTYRDFIKRLQKTSKKIVVFRNCVWGPAKGQSYESWYAGILEWRKGEWAKINYNPSLESLHRMQVQKTEYFRVAQWRGVRWTAAEMDTNVVDSGLTLRVLVHVPVLLESLQNASCDWIPKNISKISGNLSENICFPCVFEGLGCFWRSQKRNSPLFPLSFWKDSIVFWAPGATPEKYS